MTPISCPNTGGGHFIHVIRVGQTKIQCFACGEVYSFSDEKSKEFGSTSLVFNTVDQLLKVELLH